MSVFVAVGAAAAVAVSQVRSQREALCADVGVSYG